VVVLVPSTTKVVVLVAKLEVRIFSLARVGQQERGCGVSVDCSVRGGGRRELSDRGREREREREREKKIEIDRRRERERGRENCASDMLHSMCICILCGILHTHTMKQYLHRIRIYTHTLCVCIMDCCARDTAHRSCWDRDTVHTK
jgi:hypothetical protein